MLLLKKLNSIGLNSELILKRLANNSSSNHRSDSIDFLNKDKDLSIFPAVDEQGIDSIEQKLCDKKFFSKVVRIFSIYNNILETSEKFRMLCNHLDILNKFLK